MIDIEQEVKEFMKRAGQPVPDSLEIPNKEKCLLRNSLIEEEYNEYREAVGFYKDENGVEQFDIARFDPVKVVDALSDLIYVTTGGFVDLGISMNECLEEVCRSNNSKFRDGYWFREDGKLMKSPLYDEADFKSIVEKNKKNS